MPRLLLFQVGSRHYGLELEVIQEVADDPPIHAVPRAGRFVIGAINLHGQVLPVVDLPALLGIDTAPRDQRLVVLTPRFHGLSLVVSAVGRIAAFATEELRLPFDSPGDDLLAGVADIDSLSVNLLDAAAIVSRLESSYST